MERLISVECPNGLVDRMKSLGGPEVVWWTAGVSVSLLSGMRCGTGRVVSLEVVGVQGGGTEMAGGVSG